MSISRNFWLQFKQGPGVCFRLYTEDAFNGMALSGEPEILRCSLTSSILNLKCLGQNLEELDLMDKPEQDSSELGFFYVDVGWPVT